jgi:cephalosporin hydroxylase
MTAPDLQKLFSRLKQKSKKINSYFAVYQSLFEQYRRVPDLVFVEVGVLNGGSLVMWREFFGPAARIIGIDYSPTAELMRDKGFEIFIGDQGSPEFWHNFYREVGSVDVVLDDGGHTNKHQITTVECSLDHIKDGGMIVVEDTATSYLKQWGNPSRYSFMNYAKIAADKIQSRSSLLREQPNRFSEKVHGISFYESMVVFSVNRSLCINSSIVTAGAEEIGAVNFWDVDKRLISHARGAAARAFFRRLGLESLISSIYARANAALGRVRFIMENQRLRKYF